MLGVHLAVDQAERFRPQMLDEVDEGDFRCISAARATVPSCE
jgi:hypothetical protein